MLRRERDRLLVHTRGRGRAVGLQEKDPEHDEHRTNADAPARFLPSPPEESHEEHEERGRPGQGDDDANLAEAQGQQHQEDARVFCDTTPNKIEQAPSIAHQRPPVSRSQDERSRGDHRGGGVDGEAKQRPCMAQTEFANDRHHAKARRTEKGADECLPRNPTCFPLSDSKTVPRTMTSVPVRIGTVTRSPKRRMAKPVEMKGLKLLMEAATGAPTFSMPATLKSLPAAVPTTPERAK